MSRWPDWQQKQRIFREIGYTPNEAQRAAHQMDARVILGAGAERGGKSLFTGREIVARLPWCRRVAVAAQKYEEATAEMEYIIHGLDALGALQKVHKPSGRKWTVQMKGGALVETVSLKDGATELTGRGQAYDIVALVEAGRIRYDAFLAARGRVAEVRGLVLMTGTLWDSVGWLAGLYRSFEGPNAFEGQRFSLPAWANLAIYPGGRQDPEILKLEKIYTRGQFKRLVAGELVPSPARVFPEFNFPDHVQRVQFDPEAPVELAVDAGYYPSHYAVLAIQLATDRYGAAVIRQIDEVWEHHLTHHDIIDICVDRVWWPNVIRAYGGHETRQHQAAASTQEVWEAVCRQKGFRVPFEVVDGGRVMDGVIRLKTLLRDPATKRARYTCDVGCRGTQHEWQTYGRRVDSRQNVISEEPEDKNNDAIDALRNFAVKKFGLVESERRKPRPGRSRRAVRG